MKPEGQSYPILHSQHNRLIYLLNIYTYIQFRFNWIICWIFHTKNRMLMGQRVLFCGWYQYSRKTQSSSSTNTNSNILMNISKQLIIIFAIEIPQINRNEIILFIVYISLPTCLVFEYWGLSRIINQFYILNQLKN